MSKTQIPTGGIADDAVTATKTTVGGITMAEQWRLTGAYDVPSATTDITAWSIATGRGFGKLGSSMSLSSGVFTFPSTGIWHVAVHGRYKASGAARTWCDIIIEVGSSEISLGSQDHGADAHYNHVSAEAYVDVTDTSAKTVRIRIAANNTILVLGSSSRNDTYIVFTRIGDT